MPKLDTIHQAVKNALIKEGWTISADPYKIEYKDLTLYADLAADRPLAAERGEEKIVVEVKSFLGPSQVQDLKLAVGQYIMYRSFLRITAPERRLYMAVSSDVYEEFFKRESIQLVVHANQVTLFSVNILQEEVVVWTR